MFTDSLLDPNGLNSRRGWSTLASFTLQAAVVGTILVVPLIHTAGVPQFAVVASLPITAPSLAPYAAGHPSAGRPSGNPQAVLYPFVAPPSIPDRIEPGNGNAVPSAPDVGNLGIPTRNGDPRSGNGVERGLGDGLAMAVAPPPAAVVHPPRVSRIMEGNLIYRVQPDYPSLARLARIQGAVKLHAVISRQGTIENLQVVSGPPLLMKAAIDAVQRWRYRPYLLNGEPVEVETEITVNFVLS